jgi:hypothetical protein
MRILKNLIKIQLNKKYSKRENHRLNNSLLFGLTLFIEIPNIIIYIIQ